jgi:tetratricopeptide (TPR) repeat protein
MNPKSRPPQGAPAPSTAASKPPAAPPQPPIGPIKPLFRKIDWLTLAITVGIVWVVYFMCLAPEVTLEDSGELCTASYYAGIPHPPGYPFWTIYTWFWTVLIPFKNIAWRVALAEASTAAMGCGVLAFMVSRGSSMLMESIEELNNMRGKWESAICMVCGAAAGMMLAFGSSMWKESVVINRISLFGVPWLMIVLLCLMRWIYAPRQRGYLYVGMFFFGLCATIHQTLTLAALGIEIGIAARDAKLGRDMFFWNSVLYVFGWIAKQQHMVGFFNETNPMVFTIFNAIGLGSIAACAYLTIKTTGLMTEWKSTIIMGLVWFSGAGFYFYEAISGMTDPPMEWGYPRTVEGFWHAISRGQYDKVNPTDIFHDFGHFLTELNMLVQGLAHAFSWVAMFFALLPFLFIFKMQKRERAWLISVGAIYPFLGVLLAIFLNPSRERQTADLVKVFFIASHAIAAILIGLGMALTAAFMATNYQKFRLWGFVGSGIAILLSLYELVALTGEHYFGLDGEVPLGDLPHWIAQAFAPDQYGLPVIAALMLVGMTVIFLAALFLYRERAPLGIALALFGALPLYAGMTHWFNSEQHNHWFGYWFGHDMFTPPFVGPDNQLTYDAKLRDAAAKGTNGTMVYPEMARDAVLYGGTDPGRFCPTYTIFCESFIPHSCQPEQDQNYDRRDVYIITQNALADNTYLDYIRSQYNRSAQIDPPFFQNFLSGSLPSIFHGPIRMFAFLDDIFEGLGAKVEKRRRTSTSWFTPDQITQPQSLAAKLRKSDHQTALSSFLYGKFSPDTQHLVDTSTDDAALRPALSKDFNAIVADGNIYESNRFQEVKLPPLIERAATSPTLLPNNIIRLNRRMLEEAYPGEVTNSLGGVYPDTEIITATPEDSAQCFNDYLYDAQRRLQHDQELPNEPHQLKPGEDVHIDNGRVQVSGQIAVMSINGLLTKVIFDKNPDHEFYVEESFPLDWMYSYLTPFGVIMKINRHPVPELTQDIVDKDHAFWSQYSRRTIGNWITYDTTVKEVCNWAEQVYLHHNFEGFTGDRKFIRDDDAQKAFSKLRSSIGSSIYQWRSRPQNSRIPAERARVTKEAEFAFKQAFAYCPYSPEAVFHFMDLLLTQNRIEDAVAILQTCHKLDPYNGQISDWIDQLSRSKPNSANDQIRAAFTRIQQAIEGGQTNAALQMLDTLVSFAGSDPSTLLGASDMYLRLGSGKGVALLDRVLGASNNDPGVLMELANRYLRTRDMAKSEMAVQKLAAAMPTSSEPLYNLAVIQANRGEITQAIASLQKCFTLNAAEIAKNPKVINLREHVFQDQNFAQLRQTPEFITAIGTKP